MAAPGDVIFVNGEIHTLGTLNRTADALAVRDGTVCSVTDTYEVQLNEGIPIAGSSWTANGCSRIPRRSLLPSSGRMMMGWGHIGPATHCHSETQLGNPVAPGRTQVAVISGDG